MSKTFIINGIPIAWKRPGQTSLGIRYDMQKEIKEDIFYELRLQKQKTRLDINVVPPKGPLKLDITFFMPLPPSWSNKRRNDTDGMYHAIKPDTSNMIKFYEDAATGLLWHDDAQICFIEARKIYSTQPRTEITVTEIVNSKKPIKLK